MRAPWEYLENIDENVYVVDIARHELVYMNRSARAQFLHEDAEPYVGRKCYALLQGLPGPCPVCTAHILEEGRFYEWSYHSELLDKTYRLKDMLLEYEGRRYRVEVASCLEDAQKARERNTVRSFESIVNGCMVEAHSTADPDESLRRILRYLGEKFACSRMGIYELREHRLTETYRWPLEDRAGSEIHLKERLTAWCGCAACGGARVITDLSGFRRELPELYRYLDPDEGDTVILMPLCRKGEMGGFLRLDRRELQEMQYLAEVCRVLSYFIVSTLEQRDLVRHLKYLSRHDQLTRALNQSALDEFRSSRRARLPAGVIYCEIDGLQRVNDQMGHANGDQMIQQAYALLDTIPREKEIYRIGGGEFMVVCSGATQPDFQRTVEELRYRMAAASVALNLGSAWGSGDQDVNLLRDRAETQMYEARRSDERRRESWPGGEGGENDGGAGLLEELTPLKSFIRKYYFDVELFLNSIAMADTEIYLYCGDVEKNVYFISDNLKEDFGFRDNLVYDFITELEKRIYEGDRQMHIDDSRAMFDQKRTVHDIRYRIYKRGGELAWVHCRGILKWNAEKSRPLFFSGSMTGLKREAEIDSITGLMSLSGAFQKIAEHCQSRRESVLLCFTLMNFADINQAYGHVAANQILWELGCELKRQMGEEYTFIRMDGLRFLVLPAGRVDPSAAAKQICRIVTRIYERRGIHIIYPCAIGVLRCPRDGTSLQTILDNCVVALRAAKAAPGQEYVEFSSSMLGYQRVTNEINLKLNASVSNDFQGFRIVVQPQVYAATGAIYGGEVLLRWTDGSNAVPPSVFIPILEQMGLISSVGRWIVDQAIRLCQKILPAHPDFKLSFNLSYLQLTDDQLFPFIRRRMEETGVPGRNLFIELTESHSDTLPKQLELFIEQCKGLGIRFALDDFGNGYSSVQMLLQYPMDLVKFDCSLVKEMAASKEKLDFIINTIHTCHEFNKQVCIEGVEYQRELDLVRQTECDYIQGFYFYRPLELEEFCQLLDRDAKRERDTSEEERKARQGRAGGADCSVCERGGRGPQEGQPDSVCGPDLQL